MKPIQGYFSAALLAGVLLFTGCGKENITPTGSGSEETPTPQLKASSNFNATSGEELFKGIFFGEGQVTQAIPELKNVFDQAGPMSAEEQNEFNSIISETIDMIQSNHPQFFATFKSRIQSGDHFIIETTMQDAAQKLAHYLCRAQQYVNSSTDYDEALANAIKTQTGLTAGSTVDGDIYSAQANSSQLTNQVSQMSQLELTGGNGGAQLSPVWVVLVAVVAVAAVEVAVVVDMAWWFSSIAAPNEDSVLKKEMIINSIATNLKYVN